MGILNKNIKIMDKKLKKHTKASEKYIHVKFKYPVETWDGWVPVEYRRTGTHIETEEEIEGYLNEVYEQMKPEKKEKWLKDQKKFWDEKKAKVTRSFFDKLSEGGWQCVESDLPKNPNWARRIQDLKEMGYTMATDTSRYCEDCKANKTHLILLPIERGGVEGTGYETWSPTLRKKIINTLGKVDIYENTTSSHCLPDHKFPEIRWDNNTKEENPDTMTNNEIAHKFQLITNQRNQQKREVCRNCFQTGKRGTLFGIPFYYKGTEDWDSSIPTRGKEAEKGCIGCGWYDISEWRRQVIKKLKE